ncbi:MAG TPA: hypothetical protein VFN09_12730 [Rhodanobacteraceae bacterium]|nr:hypothetical protein [Rhodanobacteraceae bacterium]
MRNIDLRHAEAGQLAAALDSGTRFTNEQLRSALANALERISTLEANWEELGQAYQWFNEQMAPDQSSPTSSI